MLPKEDQTICYMNRSVRPLTDIIDQIEVDRLRLTDRKNIVGSLRDAILALDLAMEEAQNTLGGGERRAIAENLVSLIGGFEKGIM